MERMQRVFGTSQRLAGLFMAIWLLAALPAPAQTLRLKSGAFDPLAPGPKSANTLSSAMGVGPSKAPGPNEQRLLIVQWPGQIPEAGINLIKNLGGRLIQPIPDNAWLISLPQGVNLPAAAGLTLQGNIKAPRWSSAVDPGWKVAPQIGKLMSGWAAKAAVTEDQQKETLRAYNIQIARSGGEGELISRISAMVPTMTLTARAENYETWKIEADGATLEQIIQENSVFWVEPHVKRKMMGEREGLIAAGLIDNGATCIANAGLSYVDWLGDTGLSGAGVTVQVIDDGFGNGNPNGSPDFVDRVVGIFNATEDNNGNSIGGHGHLNASIILGQSNSGGGDIRDKRGKGYLSGQGFAPNAMLYVTKIFNRLGEFEIGDNTYEDLVAPAYEEGARISANSWGADVGGDYTTDSQEFDRLSRDADSTSGGLQAMTFIFAAGNAGYFDGTIGSPATAKNVISVGALENCDQGPLDGSGMGEFFSDNINDIAPFSSRGPTADNRYAPTLTFIGIHVQGSASNDPRFDGSGVSGRFPAYPPLEIKEPLQNARYYPEGQTFYTWSSGTSHSTPGVAGMAALLFEYLQPRIEAEPSPALIKAALVAGATDLTNGRLNTPGGGNVPPVPNNHSGWGRARLAGMIDDSRAQFFFDSKYVISETTPTFPMPDTIPPIAVTVDDPEEPLKIVLAWTDPPAAPMADTTLVNDLNLKVITPSGDEILGNVFENGFSVTGGQPDPRNNLECVFIQFPQPGNYLIIVESDDLNGDALPGTGENLEQDFAIAVQNGGVLSSTGRVRFDKSLYNCSSTPQITLRDRDLQDSEVEVVVSNPRNGDTESFTLSKVEQGFYTGKAFLEKSDSVSEGDGVVQVSHEDTIVVSYQDASNDLGRPNVARDVASLDCVPPTILVAELISVNENSATIFVRSDEPVTARVVYGTEADDLSSTVFSGEFLIEHTLTLTPLASCTVYFYRVEILDKAGNVASSTTVDNPSVFMTQYFEIDFEDRFEPGPLPGWTHFADIGDDDWALVEPAAPAEAHSPDHAWFVEDVPTVKDASLVSPAFEVLEGQRLVFWHTFHFEPVGAGRNVTYDGGVIEISTDKGQTWQDLGPNITFGGYTHTVMSDFKNPLAGRRAWGAGALGAMKFVSVDLAEYAGEQAQIRWRIGTDISNLFDGTGWYIDDVVLGRVLDCVGELARLKLGIGEEFVSCDLTGIPIRIEDIDLAGVSADDLGEFKIIPGDGTEGGFTFTPENLEEVEPGVWEGTISLVAAAQPGKFILGGVLEISDSQTFTVVYRDETVHGTTLDIRATATVDCIDPTLRHVSARATFEGSAIRILASEPVSMVLRIGSAPNVVDTTLTFTDFVQDRTVLLEKLVSCTSYYFNFTLRDRAGHEVTFNNYNFQFGFTTRTPVRETDTIPVAPNGAPAPTFAWTNSTSVPGAKGWQIKADYNFAKSPPYVWVVPTTAISSEVYLVSPPFDINDQANLFFWHTYFFESTFVLGDGGVIEISTDGGNTWIDLDNDIIENGYTGTITSGSNPMVGRRAWVAGGLGEMKRVTVDLSPYQGSGRRFRFRLGNDSSNASFGTQWILDDIQIANYLICSNSFPSEPLISSPNDGATSVSASAGSLLRWAATPGATRYRVYIGTRPDQLTLRGETQTASFALPTAPPLKAGIRYYWQVVAINSTGATPSAVRTFKTLGINPQRIALDIAGNPVLSETERKSVDYNDNGVLAVDDLVKALNLKHSP